MWLDIGIERMDIHKGITIKVFLNSGTTGMFMDRKTVAKHRFKLQKLKRSVRVKNVDRTYNSGGAIMHKVEVNVYYKSHVKRMRIDICDLGRTEVILGMPQLAAYNLEINWETKEVKITRCLPLCGGVKIKEKKKKERRVIILEEENIVRWAIDNKEDWGREEEIEENHRKIEEMIPEKFLKWRKVFGKIELERIPMRKIWDHAIDLKEMFVPQKGRIYLLSKDKREEVQNFVEDQLRKEYIRPTKSPQISPVFFIGKKDRKKRIVMFFGMTNLPATFQAIMNEILRDLINKGKVAVFVNDVLVGTEIEERHNEIVEEILKRLEENDLYVKPEKCV